MKTLIVPCAGIRKIHDIPLYLNKYPDGNLLAIKCIEGIYPEEYDRIIYVVLADVEKKFNVTKILKKFIDNVEVVILNKVTNGPAETIYQTLKKANINGEFVVRDSHAYVKIKDKMAGNFIAGLDLSKYDNLIDNLRDKSFIKLNEQNQVLDIVEKQICSNIISVGVYGFANSEEYISTYEHLANSKYPIEKLYLSHIISYLIGYYSIIFRCVEVTEYEDWSTLNMWNLIQKKKSTLFLDFDVLCNNKIPIDDNILNKLSELCKQGAKINLFTYQKEIDSKHLLEYFRKNNVYINNIIKNCNYSEMKQIISTEDSIDRLMVDSE